MTGQTRRRSDTRARDTTPVPWRSLILSIAVGVGLVAVGLILRSHPIDAPLVEMVNRNHIGFWEHVTDFLYRALEPAFAITLTVLITVIVAVTTRSLGTATVFAGTVALTWLPSAAIKLLVDRPRPDAGDLVHPFAPAQLDGSYPSGHTAYVTALAIAVWFLLRGTTWALVALIAGAAAIVTMGSAVVTDGLHYPTDVGASIVWALAMAPIARWAMTTVTAAVLTRRRRRQT